MITFGNNAIQFENSALMRPGSAVTFGNVIIYHGLHSDLLGDSTVGMHERQHTFQGELFGPFYLPAYGLGAIYTGFRGHHPLGEHHFMEVGPYSPTPVPWRR